MVGFVFGVILVILAVIGQIIGSKYRKKSKQDNAKTVNNGYGPEAVDRSNVYSGVGITASTISGGSVIGGLLLIMFSMFYTQDVGEANVLKDITGNVVGQETSSGLHFKAPWVDTVTFNIRNQQVVFGSGSDQGSDHTGGSVLGETITTNDKNGVAVDVDVALRYSIDPTKVDYIYRSFKTEDNFKSAFIEQDVRSAVRDTPNAFTTIQVLTARAKLQAAMQKEIEAHWKGTGVTIDSISIQHLNPPKSVTDAYAAAQKSQIKVTEATNNLAAAKVDAQQVVVKAQAESDANNLLNASLTPNILTSKYYDTLAGIGAKGNLVVVPNGSTPLIQTGK